MDDATTSVLAPGKQRSSERRARRHKLILDIATELFIRNGYHATTTEDIARDGAFSVGLIYRHFTKKEDILFEAIQSTSQRILREVPGLIAEERDPLRRFLVAVAHFHRIDTENKQSSILGIRESKSLSREQIEHVKKLETASTDIIRQCIEDCIAAGIFRPVDVEMLTYQVVMHIHNWALNAWRFSPRRKPGAYLNAGLEHLLTSVLTPGREWTAIATDIPAVDPGQEPPARARPARKKSSDPALVK